ncbi:MAG: response regulator, partial [Candidatus Margulisiibacteriota bacterium]
MNMKKNVLLVDDEEDMINPLKTVLQDKYEVRVAYSGKECLAAVKKQKPDIIVMDVMMETLSAGFDTAKILKETEGTKNIPIILLTSVTEHYDYRNQVDPAYCPNPATSEYACRGFSPSIATEGARHGAANRPCYRSCR